MSIPSPTLTTRFPFLPYILLLVPIGLYTYLILAYAENIPWYDDIEMFVVFIQEFFKANTVSVKVLWLLKPSNEHRILLAKLVALFTYYTTGHMNFRLMIIIANLFMFGTLAVLYRVFRSMRVPLWAFVPIPFFLLQPQFYLTSTWAITGLQHQGGTFLSFLVLFGLSRSGRYRFAGASFLQMLASLSMSNTLFGWLVGAVILWRQGHYRRLAVWVALCAIMVFIYRYGYTYSQGSKSQELLLAQPLLTVASVLSFAGGSFDILPNAPFNWRGIGPTLGGLILVGLIAWLVSQLRWPFQKKRHGLDSLTEAKSPQAMRDNFFLGTYMLILANAAAVGIFRIRYGYNVILISNYMIYPALLLCVVYLHGLTRVMVSNRIRWQQIGLTIAVLLWAKSYFWHLPEMLYRNKYLQAGAYNQEHNNIGLGGQIGAFLEGYIGNALTGAVKQGYYVYPRSPVSDYPVSAKPLTASVKLINDRYLIEMIGTTRPANQGYAVLQSDTRTYLAPTKTPYRLANFWLHRSMPALEAELLAIDLRPGTYRVGWACSSSVGKRIQFSDQLIIKRE